MWLMLRQCSNGVISKKKTKKKSIAFGKAPRREKKNGFLKKYSGATK